MSRRNQSYLSFRNSNRGIKDRPDDVFVTVSGSQRAVVSEETASVIRKKVRQRDRKLQSIGVGGTGIDDVIKLFEMSEYDVVSRLQL